MLKIAVVPNLTREKAFDTTVNVVKQLDELGIESFFDKNLKNEFADVLNCCNFTDDLFETADIIIAIGGDGSFIRTAKQAAMHNKPVLCINAGNLAFLAGLEGNELKLLEKLITGDYSIDKRMMLKAVIKSPMVKYRSDIFLMMSLLHAERK